ncbi:VWA domain-containing protein [Acuticoccus sp. I52.16.1]|uniref:vWA domain-containing protein n=1 Tax=Acuticoccus sp. I52.16.1 TaxID=2928472 RepID=UPI001FD45E61|nr:vWA domain-containing protein [Acuticoccus sp. I52.16.1]UOM35564.1 VWA domain-containing protein [Acuticoccus sp. I52.16.1]
MIEIAGLTLMRPWWLAALPVIAAVAALAARRERRAEWASLIDPRLAAHLAAVGFVRAAGRDRRILSLALAAAIAALALSGPATKSETAPALRSLDTMVVAVDMSRSMTEGGALDRARAVTARLLASAARPAALVLFAGDAYLASAPADDPELLETLVAALGPDTMPDAGSRPDRALALAAEILPTEGAQRRDVVLISDGGGIGPQALAAVETLAASGVVVSAIFVAPEETAYAMPRPQPEALARLAAAGGGTATDLAGAQRLADDLAAAVTTTVPRDIAALMYDDHGRALLLLSLFPALLVFRRAR